MSDIEQLRDIRQQALARIAELVAEPKPSYTVDGQSVDWSAYLGRLEHVVSWCDERLARLAPPEAAEPAEPVEIASQAIT